MKVSIIVGIYNSGLYLRKCLQSIQNQTYTDIEVLCMNDGSKDNSGDICDEFANKDNRFIHISKPNSGVCDSRNLGLSKATGDYVCFVDGDDWLSDDFVEYMLFIIEKTNTKMAMSYKLFTTRDQVQVADDKIEIKDSSAVIEDIIYFKLKLGPWNKIYSMDIIKNHNIKFPEKWFGETLHFANTVAHYAENIGVGYRKVYNYRLNNASSGTTTYNVENRLISLNNSKNLFGCPFAGKNKKIDYAIKWHIYNNYFELIKNIVATNSKKEFIKEYKEAKKYIWKNFLGTLIRSDLKMKKKFLIILQALCPVIISKLMIKDHTKKLKKDKME